MQKSERLDNIIKDATGYSKLQLKTTGRQTLKISQGHAEHLQSSLRDPVHDFNILRSRVFEIQSLLRTQELLRICYRFLQMVHFRVLHCFCNYYLTQAAKYSYFNLMAKPIERILNPNYDGETRDKKTQYMLKLSYDTIFYTIATAASYLTFRKEYWFPTAVGGCGSCAKIYS